MPIDPKQQPPYYTPATRQAGTTTTNVAEQTTIIESDGTNITPAALYTMPANTLNQNGDILKLKYWGNTYNSPTGALIKLNIFENIINTYTITTDTAWILEATIIRISSTTAYYAISILAETISPCYQGSIGAIDFTTPYEMQLTIQEPMSGNIRCSAGYTQLIK